ncbi:NADH-quinone oxidoreductase subunit J [Roseospirillum parvum]|uniref:NADH-quinone oxidoreductase subunit J n=1 Tax=Roseospirillum parvum TaxID=83401 RepID=A0A1G8B4W0_9PROT|nr:NADH-quinone oxidoreductase subunit J [Roseospirillum parvum]SDH28174.1 NADH-quinone oxidoreductase subunit J [Roseospirillum parvum]
MIVQALAFYLFATVAVLSAGMVITQRNSVHAVLWLILAFFNGAGLFVLTGAEFVAMLLVIVYVGAVAVLFLFVVMMLDLNVATLREGFVEHVPMVVAVGFVLLAELLVLVGGWAVAPEAQGVRQAPTPDLAETPNTEALGAILYTDFLYLFQAAGLILLVAMVGAIVLTHRRREGVRKQRIPEQIARRKEDELTLVDVPPRGGV